MTKTDTGERDFGPRICMPTWRNVRKEVFRCGLYEAEDVLVETDDVDLICVEAGAGYEWRSKWQRRLACLDLTERIGRANPGLRRVNLTRDYDLFVALIQWHGDLLNLNAINGWRDHSKVSVCWIDEIWVSWIQKYRHLLIMLRDFDHVFVSLKSSVAPLSEALGRPCHWLPLGIDTMRFSPEGNSRVRVIDVLSMGRREEGVHKSLKEVAARNGAFYLYDTFGGSDSRVFDYRQHRELLASLSQRSRYFVVAPAAMDEARKRQGQIAFGPRYLEGAAGGALLLGQSPSCSSFREMYDWQDAVIEIRPDGSDVADVLQSLVSNPERTAKASSRNVIETMLRHDWIYRWQNIYSVAGINPSPGMLARHQSLKEQAQNISKGPKLQRA